MTFLISTWLIFHIGISIEERNKTYLINKTKCKFCLQKHLFSTFHLQIPIFPPQNPFLFVSVPFEAILFILEFFNSCLVFEDFPNLSHYYNPK